MDSKDFNQLMWHDSELCHIAIDRKDPGNNDNVVVDVQWQNGEFATLIFEDCYELEMRMNFGVIAPETILQASAVDQSIELDRIKAKWRGIGVDLNGLRCFEILTNSTASIFRVYALNCVINADGSLRDVDKIPSTIFFGYKKIF
ncbi:hypothetical protein KFZ76_02585 [Methylovulum psychrotolerans]|uniref:hypothetical protein n=1 Tax=Methylovulum psychrotolerans TaxID=1704499 RepID=UPI001BFFAB56|nr:hypothetical protein [Methylovulum psychrotolerans]MBT9096598.1 hypothetical protein [Methylovulum psychrotolerans]